MLPARTPARETLTGRYVRLEPLALCHAAALAETGQHPDASRLFRYLPNDEPPRCVAEMEQWMAARISLSDPMFYACVDMGSRRAVGRQSLMRITPEHGVIEIGNILWGPDMARTRLATESLFLMARHVFDALGYRRFEWKCDALNEPSRRAALRFGFVFEGIFRQHMWVKGRNRDTAWYAMLDHEWPRLRHGFERWLAADNFGPDGRQRVALAACVAEAR
jgi:RimJ/RimL family protein N-acetyltransferase